MKKAGLLLSSLILMVNFLFAQSIDEGKKFLNYELYEKAAQVFKQLLATDPNNIEAAYWLGQTYLQNLDNIDSAAAKELYQKTLQANPNEALIMVGVGEVELMEGKSADARNRFETAINTSKRRDRPAIQLAVGRANVNAKNGSAEYAIDKLKEAADRDKKNAEIYIVLGDAYRKLIDGANATVSYQTAISMDPKNARPYFMIGRIYETQGFGQEPIYMKYYNDAIAADPDFAPVYYWLYSYYYQRDVNKAREYLNSYVKVAGPDSRNCYAEASLLYVSNMYDEAIAKAEGCITNAPEGKPYPNLFGLKAYAYNKLGDSAKAKASFEQFFEKVNPDNIGPTDYATYAEVLLKFPGNFELAESYVDKAIELDTVPANKLNYVRDIGKSLFDDKKYEASANWYKKILTLTPDYGKVDLYWVIYPEYLASDYEAADSASQLYKDKFPDDLFGWYMAARSKEGLDTAESGLAFDDYNMIIKIADTTEDKKAIADKLIPAYRFMVAYYYNLKGDAVNALLYNNKILEVDPEDANAIQTKTALETVVNRANPPAGR